MDQKLRVLIRRLPGGEEIPLPQYQTRHSAAMDLHASNTEPIGLAPGEVAMIPCGFAMAVPEGYEAQVRPRSGLAAKFGVTVLNAPGTIDADYRGEVKVILANLGTASFTVETNARVAQMLIAPVPRVEWEEVEELPETDRGSGGFGHTGR